MFEKCPRIQPYRLGKVDAKQIQIQWKFPTFSLTTRPGEARSLWMTGPATFSQVRLLWQLSQSHPVREQAKSPREGSMRSELFEGRRCACVCSVREVESWKSRQMGSSEHLSPRGLSIHSRWLKWQDMYHRTEDGMMVSGPKKMRRLVWGGRKRGSGSWEI